MTRSRGRPESKTFHVSCSDAQWEDAKRRAAAAGMKTSPWLVERALNADLSIFDNRPEPERLVLSAEDQDLLSHQVDFILKVIGSSPDPAWLEKLGNQVEFLRDAKVTEMIADGRIDELFLAFEKLFGPENAERLLAKAVKQWHGAKSVEVKVGGPTRRA